MIQRVLCISNQEYFFYNSPVAQETGDCEELPSQKMKKDERLVGQALYFYIYSSVNGRVLYLDDLFVRAEYRSKQTCTVLAIMH